MKNLAVIIGVSNFNPPTGNLPACKIDSEGINDIIIKSGRFDDVLYITEENETTSSNIKKSLSEFAEEHIRSDINEVLFYFTGHGNFHKNEFYYILSDYEERRRNQTSLSNSELDGIFRSLNPKLFVKIVDACQSGITYIKSDSKLEDYLKSSNESFKSIYFMFSSQSDEASYANNKISHFTKSLIAAVADAPVGPVRYRDLMSAISDDFETSGRQTPLFVIQAKNTEVFCETSKELKQELAKYLEASSSDKSDKSLTLQDRVRMAEEAYCTELEAIDILNEIPIIFGEFQIPNEISELYTKSVTCVDFTPHNSELIGKWLKDTKIKELFAEYTKELEIYEEEVTKSRSSIGNITDIISNLYSVNNPTEIVKKEKFNITGYKITAQNLPFAHIYINLVSSFSAVNPIDCHIAPILSRTSLHLFYRFSNRSYTGWSETNRIESTTWARLESPLKKSAIRNKIYEQIWLSLTEYAQNLLYIKFPDTDKADDIIE